MHVSFGKGEEYKEVEKFNVYNIVPVGFVWAPDACMRWGLISELHRWDVHIVFGNCSCFHLAHVNLNKYYKVKRICSTSDFCDWLPNENYFLSCKENDIDQ